ncbi:uncharacterized protein BCR38DRAFT_411959 [Pseudomassariella vexata]|uniref:Uncharacterized protein n=1 Tax=Pseudomassariella vexata TaxID=1141098 RepID=A0A1Y2DNU7_9PEZI|nr:uncharacterized protein BCR38DRAFT_411959 [Pseudomassariella vexata]ORY60849.1 hypothetical protein BCR38DRAFT_411959 [Pseudomassariella vexata]
MTVFTHPLTTDETHERANIIWSGSRCHEFLWIGILWHLYGEYARADLLDILFRSEKTTTTPSIPYYSQADADSAVRKYGYFQVGPGYTFQELWDACTSFDTASLEEGVIRAWWM